MIPTALNVPTPDWPLVGDFTPIALLFSVHMVFAQFTLGAITMGPLCELRALRGGGERWLRLARTMANAYYLMFSVGATLGVFAVTALIGLWGNDIGTLVNRFLPLIGVAFGSFFVVAPSLVIYKNTFTTMRPGLHVALGFWLWAWQTLFMVCIVAVDAYMILPRSAGLLGGASNPVYIDLLLHRFVGNVSWAALILAAVAVLRLRGAVDEPERAYRAWMAQVMLRIGTVTLLVMPVLGYLLVRTLQDDAAGFFDNLVRGDTAWLFVIQAAMLAVLFVGANVALALEMRRGERALDTPGVAAVVLSAAGMVVGLLPAQVLTDPVHDLRYAGIGLAVVVTLAHLAVRSLPRRSALRLAPAPGAQLALPYTASATARRAVTLVGLMAAVLSIYMGFMKEEARGPYAVYGELTQHDAHGAYSPTGTYP